MATLILLLAIDDIRPFSMSDVRDLPCKITCENLEHKQKYQYALKMDLPILDIPAMDESVTTCTTL